MKVYIPQDIDPAGKNYLLERGYELKMGSATDKATMMQEITDCDAVIIRVAKLDREIMEAAPNLKVIGRHGVGTDNIDLAAAKELGIRVTNGPLSNSDSVAEHTVAMILSLARILPALDRAVHSGDFGMRNRIRLIDLAGKTAGLIGSGRIAQSVARKLVYGFDMKVLTWGTSHPENLPEYMTYEPDLDKLLASSDIVSLHCPANERSRNLINAAALAKMKDDAILVNTARGEVIDEKALYDTLAGGKLRGVGLDVYSKEPYPADSPLLTLPNVICSPHCASHTNESFARMALHAAMGVHEVLSGSPVSWPVV